MSESELPAVHKLPRLMDVSEGQGQGRVVPGVALEGYVGCGVLWWRQWSVVGLCSSTVLVCQGRGCSPRVWIRVGLYVYTWACGPGNA